MGDALILSLVSDVLRKLTSVAIQEFGLLQSLTKDVLTLKDDFDQIQAVLEDAEEKHVKEKAIELWLTSLRSASLKVENVLDEVLTEAMLQRLHKERGVIYKVRAFFSSNHNQLMVRTRIAHKVKTIRRQLDAIAAKRFDLKLTPGGISSIDVGAGSEMPNRETSSLIHSSIIYGRTEEMEMVIEKICNKDIVSKHDVDNIRVYAIRGMGGLGKTTLAQLVYNHERVDQHFELKCWMYVSESFQVKELIKGIIESIDKSECRISLLDAMQVDLQDKLRGKRFLIVLDDVWIEDGEKEKWDGLSKTLSCGAEGSIVVMTTRSKTTSRMMAKVPELQHELGCLSEDDSWSLFKKLAFAEGREGGDIRDLEPIGKKIVKKCKGLPLAVKTLGGLMWSKNCTSDWERVMGSDIWELEENKILPALKLSYDNLLPHLKRCFAYCCLFPKGYKMEMDVLIPSWMANGLIPSRGEVDLYVLGKEVINNLVWKSFFQVVQDERSYLGDRYKMHDLLHDLAQYVMRHDCSVIEPGKEFITPEEVLHLSSSCTDFVFSDQALKRLRSLRSIFIFKAYDYESSISHIFDLVYLRVLYMVGIRLRTLPASIGKLKYLKYLNLSWSKIEVLPELIVYLQNLQVLLLKCCENLRKLPKGMRFMRNLQRLDISSCHSLMYLPVGIKYLTHLRILPIFPISKKNGARIGELRDLNLLDGDLLISGLKNVGGFSEAKNANLKCKRNLLVLYLHWGNDHVQETKPETIVREEKVLDGLEPNPSLKELDISSCMGKIFCMSWIVNLKNLVRISFHACTNCEQIPPLGKLPSLRVIEILWMDSLKFFHDDENTTSGDNIMFSALQELDIQSCWKLVSLPDNFPKLEVLNLMGCRELVSLPSNLPKLKKLHITDCKSLHSLPDEIQSFKDLNKLEIWECDNLRKRYEEETGVDWLQISHIPYISFEAPRQGRGFRHFNLASHSGDDHEEYDEDEDESWLEWMTRAWF